MTYVKHEHAAANGIFLTKPFVVLQLKLKRAEQPRTRDKTAGVWYIYYAVGGAITVLQENTRPQL